MIHYVITVTEGDIARGVREDFNTHPLLCSLARALGEDGFDVLEEDGTKQFPVSAAAVQLAGGGRVTLPARCQWFLRAWEYGPMGGQPLAIRNRLGEVIALHSYDKIVAPFTFVLEKV